jgi:hypothetical protein
VTKQFAFDQVRRQGRAVDFNQGPRVAGAQLLNRPRDEFLAHAGFTEKQDRGVGGGDLLDPEEDGLEDIALPDDLVEVVRPLDLFVLLSQFVFGHPQLLKESR